MSSSFGRMNSVAETIINLPKKKMTKLRIYAIELVFYDLEGEDIWRHCQEKKKIPVMNNFLLSTQSYLPGTSSYN